MLSQKIDDVDKKLNQKIELVKTDLENQIKATNSRINDVNNRIDTLSNYILALFSGLMALIGFIYWDRRSMATKAKEEAKQEAIMELKDTFTTKDLYNKIVDMLKELSMHDEKVAKTLKGHSMEKI